jgi:hypothetical protein
MTKEITYEFVSSQIPEFLNCLYNEEALSSTSLEEIRDAFRKKQIEGKTLLLSTVEQFCPKDAHILVVGGWLGFTSFCLNKMGYSYITEVDPDNRLTKITSHANRFNKNFKHISKDINEIDIKEFDTIINTSCEHILEDKWFKECTGTFFLQSTDYPNWDHINTCQSLEEMKLKYPMQILFEQTLDLGSYKRFFLVGKK